MHFSELKNDADGIEDIKGPPDGNATEHAVPEYNGKSSVFCGRPSHCHCKGKPVIICGIVLGSLICGLLTYIIVNNSQQPNRRIAHITDTHLDLYYDTRYPATLCRCHHNYKARTKNHSHCLFPSNNSITSPYGSYECDSPMKLFEQAITAVAKIDLLEAVIFTGDYVRHGARDLPNGQEAVLAAIEASAQFIKKKISAPFISTYGNNDFQENYYLNISKRCNQPFLKESGKIIRTLLPGHSQDAERTIDCGGYYRYDLLSIPGIRVLSLNTVLFSVKHKPRTTQADPAGQFAWMAKELHGCRLDKSCKGVWLVGHVPPGNEYCDGAASWQEQYVEKYVELLRTFRGTVTAQFFGHEHINSVRLISALDADMDIPPLILAASVSPIYLNRPSFRIIDVDTMSGKVVDINVHSKQMEGPETEQTFAASFGYLSEFSLPDLSSQSVSSLIHSFLEGNPHGNLDNAMFKRYVERQTDRKSVPGDTCQPFPNICTLLYVLASDIAECRAKYGI